MAKTPDRPIALLQKVVAGDRAAWQEFVKIYAGFIHALAWRYARGDQDVASELCLVTLEGLQLEDAEGRPFYRLRRYLDSLHRFGKRSRFVTWLAVVARNLIRDHFRSREGRRLLPTKIEELRDVAQDVFRSVFWEGLPEHEAFEWLKSRRPELTPRAFEAALDEVYRHLSDRNLWGLYQDLLRRLPALPLEAAEAALLDQRPFGQPDAFLEHKEERQAAERLRRLLQEAIRALPEVSRQVVELLWFQNFSADQVRRSMGFAKRQRVYDELAKARRMLQKIFAAEGIGAAEVRALAPWLKD